MQINQKPGIDSMKSHSAFESVGQRRIDSLNITVEEYRHKKTGVDCSDTGFLWKN